MSCFEIVVLEQFLVLEVAELGLHSVQLVAQSQVVFVTLLNFKDFCFQLTDQQVFLVRGQMH